MRKLPACALLFLSACGGLPTAPDEDRRAVSALGYHVEANQDFLKAGGVVTPAHGELADRWWGELMLDLQSAGYTVSQADPSNIRGYIRIRLAQPQNEKGDIFYSDNSKLVGSYYDRLGGSLVVPGNYPYANWTAVGRPNSQPLKHEMLHLWCFTVLKHDCLAPGLTSFDTYGHVYPAPNGVNVWDYTWH